MTKDDLTSVSIDDLVNRFAEIGIEQGKKIYDRDTKGFTPLYYTMVDIDNELRGRGLEARRALMRLYDHPNPQVRLQAAKFAYGADPMASRGCLEALGKSGFPPQAFEARMSLSSLDDGTSMLN